MRMRDSTGRSPCVKCARKGHLKNADKEPRSSSSEDLRIVGLARWQYIARYLGSVY